ncbi:MAG TPA: dUTP diphosphatase [Oscillospiraceae bacterium]|nr:dUTP diphosphatase [Oscillospiraceae bacterium]HPS75115.1 dUTP diphosphatase [Oscillospiraceae bacterium]
MKIQIKKLRPGAQLPTAGSAGSAGSDLYACIEAGEALIPPGETVMVGTGISAAVPEGYFGAVFARSGLASKQGLRPANCVGVCDSDYRGEYIVALHNDSLSPRVVRDGDRIAQLVVLPFVPAEFEEADTLPETRRGAGGFGSTGE